MVSAKTEAALHPKPDGDSASDPREATAAAAMAHSLTASRNLMAALAPLAPPPGFKNDADDNGRASSAADATPAGSSAGEVVRMSCQASAHFCVCGSSRSKVPLQDHRTLLAGPAHRAYCCQHAQAPAAADVGLQFRLYRKTNGNRALLHRVDLPQETLDKVNAGQR